MRRIAVLTSGRQDYGILRSTILRLRDDPRFALELLVTGMHLAEGHGHTARFIEADGVPIARRIPTTRADAAEESASTLSAVAAALREIAPEALMLVGDRFETAAAALAATISAVPVVHLHGGEETEGASDNLYRHAITKLAHLHLVSHQDHASRVAQMGEDPASIHVVGAPGLDNLRRGDLPDRDGLAKHLGVALRPPVVVVTYHPTTLADSHKDESQELVAALRAVPATYVITLPNNDPGAAPIRNELTHFGAGNRASSVVVEALGEARYFALMRIADAMLGNSSSALIEAPIFQLPAVNIGDRQKGRLRASNVIDCPIDAATIVAALRRALDPSFRSSLTEAFSPYGDGRTAPRIVEILSTWQPGHPPRKRFHSWRPSNGS